MDKIKKTINKEALKKIKKRILDLRTVENKQKFETIVLICAYIFLIYAALFILYIIINGLFIWGGISFWSLMIYLFIEVLIGISFWKNDTILIIVALLVAQLVI